MNQYEAMVILSESMSEEELEKALENLKGEIANLGGEVDSATRIGRKPFARTMQKQQAGEYALMVFKMDGQKLPELHQHIKLAGEIFRIQVCRMQQASA